MTSLLQGWKNDARCCSAVLSRYFPTLWGNVPLYSPLADTLQAATSKESANLHKLLRPRNFQDSIFILQGWRQLFGFFPVRKWTKFQFGINNSFTINQSKPILYSCKSPVLFSCAASTAFSWRDFSALAPLPWEAIFCPGLFAWQLPYHFCFSPQ